MVMTMSKRVDDMTPTEQNAFYRGAGSQMLVAGAAFLVHYVFNITASLWVAGVFLMGGAVTYIWRERTE